ncbi:MAG: 50S ribosomal protein L2 [Thermoprotei archaeon ex4572_64]|nr:MAG: 50S ribosomal protein L2 [Thermoprotei archaeon ex4572_64]
MGKRLLVQRRGKASPTFICPSWKREGPIKYVPLDDVQLRGVIRGVVKELTHIPGISAPVARIILEDGREMLNFAVEGMYVGQIVEIGFGASTNPGNVLPLSKIPEGTMVCNVEKALGDGGKFARAGGTYAIVLSHKPNGKTVIQLPSGKVMEVDSRARATIGIVAGGGRTEKPFVKAGKKYHLSKAKAWKYPTVRGKAMGAYAHPHGGGHHPTGSTPVPRTAPPGQKVGFIAPRCTGRRCSQIIPYSQRYRRKK